MPDHRMTSSRLYIALATLCLAATATQTEATKPRAQTPQEISYGSDRLQRVDFWRGSQAKAPLVLFVHGGGWKRGDKSMMKGSAKLTHWQSLGYAVASVNYRLVPSATVEQQAQDIADALARLKRDAGQLGFDSTRIVLVGHSAGAHLVALVGTDPTYLRKAGLSYRDIAGIVSLDGAAYDVPAQMGENPRLLGDTYRQAFGTDPERLRALSPTHHAASPNASSFLILHVQRRDGTAQAQGLARTLEEASTPARVQGLSGRGLRGHAEINRKLGEADYPATAVVDRYLASRFGG